MIWHRLTPDEDGHGRRIWRCLNCGHVWTELPPIADRTGCPGIAA